MTTSQTYVSFIAVALAACGLLLGCRQDEVEVAAPQVLVEHAGWTWFNDERALFAGPHLYIGYVDTTGYSSVAVLSLETEAGPQIYSLGSFQEKDDHNNPAFVQLQDGRMLAAYAPHHTQYFWYWRFAEVHGADSVHWSPEQKTIPLEAKTTYSNLFQLGDEDGRIYNFYRGTNFDPVYMTSADGGRSWSTMQHFIFSGDRWTRPYVKYASDGASRIDMLYTHAHPRDAVSDIYHVYYENGNLYQSDGALIQPLPGGDVAPMPVDAGTLIYDTDEANRAWVWDLEYDARGAPVAAYLVARDSTTGNDLRYHYAYWDHEHGQWHDHEMAYAGTHLYDGENHYAGGITLDPSDTRTVYTSSDVHPATGDTTAHYQIYRGTTADAGATWTWTTLTPDATEDHIRPFVPRSNQEHHAVLWLRGRYTSYQDFDMDIVGLLK